MDASEALKEVVRMHEEVLDMINRIDMEEEDQVSEGFDPEDCRGLARRVKRELKEAFTKLRKKQRVVPCLRNKDVGNVLRRYTWPINLECVKDLEEGEPIVEAAKQAMCDDSKEAGSFTMPVGYLDFEWLPMKDATQAVSYRTYKIGIDDNKAQKVHIRFHATSVHAMAKLLQRCGDFGYGTRVTARKVLEFLAVCAHTFAPLSTEGEGTSFSVAQDTSALPSAVQGLLAHFGITNPLRPITNPFASTALVNRTSDHFDKVSVRRNLKSLRHEVLLGLARLERRVQRMEKWREERGTHEYQQAALERIRDQEQGQ